MLLATSALATASVLPLACSDDERAIHGNPKGPWYDSGLCYDYGKNRDVPCGGPIPGPSTVFDAGHPDVDTDAPHEGGDSGDATSDALGDTTEATTDAPDAAAFKAG